MPVVVRAMCVLTPLILAVTGIRSLYLEDWWLENLIVFAAILGLVAARSRLALSNASWVLLFVFLCLHEYGAAYSYSNMPWFGEGRNQYDKLVHFLFGLMLTPVFAEMWSLSTLLPQASVRFFAVVLVAACGSLYEVVEWIVAANAAPELGVEFLGAQGDMWDAQKDQAIALGVR